MLAKHALSQLSYGPLAWRVPREAKGFALASIAGGDVRLLGSRPIRAGAPSRQGSVGVRPTIEPKHHAGHALADRQFAPGAEGTARPAAAAADAAKAKGPDGPAGD